MRSTGLKVETGCFQAHMLVEIHNDGPVTIVLDSRESWGRVECWRACMSPVVIALRVDTWYDLFRMSCNQVLKEKGYRLTPQRVMVLDALHRVDRHISAEEIYSQVKNSYPYANISTVYRTLDLLKELGLITEIDLDDGRVRYHLAEKGHHHHLVCTAAAK